MQLYSVCTHFQLIIAIIMKTIMFPDKIADIIIHDHSNGYVKVANRLKKFNIFRHVWIAETKEYIKRNNRYKQGIKILLNSDDIIRKTCSIDSYSYDEYYFYNFTLFNVMMYYKLKKEKHNLICRRFEEGYGALLNFCDFNNGSANLLRKLEKIHHNYSIDSVNRMYTFEPELSCFDDQHFALPIPKLKKECESVKFILNNIFDYNEDEIFSKKYIYFEESYFADSIDIDDVELVLKIANLVGKENLMVKLHPRNPIDRFTELGIKTIGQSGCPWEVIAMNHDFSNNVFLTIASASVLSPRIIFDDNIPTFMLYNCTKVLSPMLQKENFQKFIEKFRSKYGKSGFYIPNNFEDFQNILRKRGL